MPDVEPGGAVEYAARCRAALDFALARVPFYRAWQRFDPGPDQPIGARFAALPVMGKADLRAHFPHGFVPDRRDLPAGLRRGDVEYVHTSGTTDERVTLLFLNEKADVALWTDDDVRRMADELAAYRPVVLEADAPYLAALARRALALGLELYQPAFVFFTYSYPSRAHRRLARRAFRAPMASSHGSTETGYVFTQCEEGRFHQNTAFCHVDLRPWKETGGGPAMAALVVTALEHPGPGIYRLRLVPEEPGDERPIGMAREALRRLYGADAVVEVALAPSIVPEPNGKYRLARPLVPVDPESFVA